MVNTDKFNKLYYHIIFMNSYKHKRLVELLSEEKHCEYFDYVGYRSIEIEYKFKDDFQKRSVKLIVQFSN